MSAKNYMVLFTESHLDKSELLKEPKDKEQILLGKSIREKLNTTSDLKELDKLHYPNKLMFYTHIPFHTYQE